MSWLGGRRVLYSATGDGAVVCVNARTGEPIWRVLLDQGGHQFGRARSQQ